MVFHWSLSESKSPQVSWTPLSILVDLNNAVVWMVATCPLISMSSSPCTKPLVIVPYTPITVGVTFTFMFHSFFFSSLARSMHLSLSYFSPVLSYGQSKRHNPLFVKFSFFLSLTMTWSGCLAEIRWSVCISKFQRVLCVSFSRTDSWLCIYHSFVWSNINFWHSSQWITLPT